MALSKTAYELAGLLKELIEHETKFSGRDGMIGTMLVLNVKDDKEKAEENFGKMLEWLKKEENKNATVEEIFNQSDIIAKQQ